MLPFLGSRNGEPAVLDVIRRIADNVQVRRFEREAIMLGVDSAASMLRCCLIFRNSDKPVSLRVAQFANFREGRLINMRVLVHTFDLVEQVIGRPLHLPRIASVR